MNLSMAALVLAGVLTTAPAHAQDDGSIATVCQGGAARFFQDVQKYYGCVRSAAVALEPSQATADLIAVAATSQCSAMLTNIQIEATSCDAKYSRNNIPGLAQHFSSMTATFKQQAYDNGVLAVLTAKVVKNGQRATLPEAPQAK